MKIPITTSKQWLERLIKHYSYLTMCTSFTANIRPYSSYNIFFQLEREYILQALLGHQPKAKAGEDLDIDDDDAIRYSGPPLPPRYADLVLPRDWHVPGKNQRRKRSHRKTHGKIGFQELNAKISKAWKEADGETLGFCKRLADAEAQKYKAMKSKMKVKVETKEETKAARTPNDDDEGVSIKKSPKRKVSNDAGNGDCESSLVPTFNWEPVVDSPRDHSTQDSTNPEDTRCLSGTDKRHRVQKRPPLREVDMDDDDIIEIWKSTTIEAPFVPSILCQFCVEIPRERVSPAARSA